MRALILATALYASAAVAADWVFVANNGDNHRGNRIFFAKTSIVATGGYRKVWLKLEGFTVRADGVLTPSGHDSKQLWKLHCHERTYVIVTLLSDGHDLSEMMDHSPIDIQPESWMELLHRQVCE